MSEIISKLVISPAPHLRGQASLSKMMWFTVLALAFPAAGGIFFFGIKALYLLFTSITASVITELLCLILRKEKIKRIKDGSAVVTGVILALVLPTSFPLWAAALGAFFAIAIVKHVFGGLGKNIFNPALMGRAFLTAAFPVLITTYTMTYRTLTAQDMSMVNAVSSATPLSATKFDKIPLNNSFMFSYFIGEKKGSMGETSGLLILIGLFILLGTKTADFRLAGSYFVSVFLFSGLLWLISPGNYMNPVFTMLLGGVLLGGTYMVTDPVTSPVTGKGKLVFGIGSGILTVVIRTWSGYPEGVMFSIILMNAITPLINRYTKPKIFGT